VIADAYVRGRALTFGLEEQNIMKVRAIYSSFVIGMLAVASCTLGAEDDTDDLATLSDEGELGSVQEGITKGNPGAVSGALDYCNNPASLCAWGEGDCDSSAQCEAGLACAPNNGLKFGFSSIWDVCAGAHCSNGVLDGNETTPDCGGSCGTCTTCVGTPGGRNFCVGCVCASGEGDCDSSAECAPGLMCATNNGPKFDLPANIDVCVPSHCTNRMQDLASGETGVDRGGPCELPCGNGGLDGGEVCDDGINDGLLCNSQCSATGPEVARIHLHCDAGSGVINSLRGTECIVVGGGGASFITFSSSAVNVTLYRNNNCTGSTKTVSTNMNFCSNSFDQGGGLNDQVRSVKITRK
jgi:hypothetical protein